MSREMSLELAAGNDGGAEETEEFESTAVPQEAWQDNWTFASIFAGRHTAAPELVIGPMFVQGGATFGDMVLGCLVGNILAVLAWRFVCAPIAVTKRFSTYYTVKRICGNRILALYNVMVALVLGGIAGFMYILASNAVSIGLGIIDEDYKDGFIVTDVRHIIVTFLTGSFTTFVAMFGFKFVTQVSYWLTPPMFIIIGYLIWAACGDLEMGFGNFVDKMETVVFTGEVKKGAQFTLVVVILTAFVQDQFAHVGLIDLTMFRFAKDANAGWQSAWGMYLGHFFLWIGAGILFRSQQEFILGNGGSDEDAGNIVPGPMAYRLAGFPGLLCILFASWSTANPFLYAGGLALKSCCTIVGLDRVSSRTVTGITGLIATLIAFMPGLVGYFLLFVQFSGAFLVPIGGIIVADTYLFPKLELQSDFAFKQGSDCQATNVPAGLAWLVSTGITAPLIIMGYLPGIYGPFLCFPVAVAIYCFVAKHSHTSQHDLE